MRLGWFCDLIRFDDELLTIFAGNMGSDRYKEAEKIIACAALPKSKALLRAVFTNQESLVLRKLRIIFLVMIDLPYLKIY